MVLPARAGEPRQWTDGLPDVGHWIPENVHLGPGRRAVLLPLLAGRKLLVVASRRGRRQFENDPILSRLDAELHWVDSVSPNPGLAQVQSEIDHRAGQSFDAVLAFGGGSVLDTAKALAAALSPGQPCRDLARLIAQPDAHLSGALLPVHAIPTTSGTGSEVTPFATIWDHEARRKLSLTHPGLIPAMAVVDAEVTHSLPHPATIATSLDALNQAFESIWNRNRTRQTTTIAARAIGLCFRAIPQLAAKIYSAEARTVMSEASLLAGLCIGVTRTSLCHSISYPMTANFGLPHGIACVTTMKSVYSLVSAQQNECIVELADILGLRGPNDLFHELSRTINHAKPQSIVGSKMPTAEALSSFLPEILSSERANNFILPVDAAVLKGVLSSSL